MSETMHLIRRYGAGRPPHPVTVQSILDQNLLDPPTADPFAYLLIVLHRDLYDGNEALRTAGKVFTGILSVALACSVFCFGFRLLFRSDRCFYKMFPTPAGSFIMPNVMQIWLLANICYCSLAIPYVWRACLIQGGSLFSHPIWISLVWISIFIGVWHVTWGTCVSAVLQASRLSTTEGGSSRGAIVVIRPWLVNLVALTVLFASIGVMAGTGGGETVTWNRGSDAWNLLHAWLVQHFHLNNGAPGDAATVTDAIPLANAWLDEMTIAFWRYSIPWIVCLTFSAFTALVMSVACFVQVLTLSRQIRVINREMRRAKTASVLGPAASTSSSLESRLQRRKGLIGVLRNVIATSVALTVSMMAYVVSCVIGELDSNMTPIFRRHKDSLTHLYVILFGYGTVSLAVVLLILRQTFDRTVLQTKFSSNARHSSQPGAAGASAAGSSSTYTQKLPMSPGSSRPFSPPFTPPGSSYHDSAMPGSPGGAGGYELGDPRGRGAGVGVGVGRDGADARPLLEVPRGVQGWSTYQAPGQGQQAGRMVEDFGADREGSGGSHASWEGPSALPPGAGR